MVLTPILLMILYPLSPALRLYEFVRWLLGQVLSWLEMLEEEDTATFIRIEAFLSIIEQFLHSIIGKLATERLGLTFRKKPSMGLMPQPQPGKPLSFQQVFNRFERLVQMFEDIDRLVARRVRQIRKELDANPLGLAPIGPSGHFPRKRGKSSSPVYGGVSRIAANAKPGWGRVSSADACVLIRAPP